MGSVAEHILKLLEGLILLFNATVTPIAIAYGLIGKDHEGMTWASTSIDVVYAGLMVCKFRTSYYNEEGDLCY